MKNILAALLSLASIVFTVGVEAGEQPQPDNADSGFSRYIQHYPVGSKTVLIFETHSPFGAERFGVAADFVDDNIEVFNKFLKWAEMAKERGDILNKEIATVKAFDHGLYYFLNKYEFETGRDAKDYYLKVTSGTKLFGLKFKPQDPTEDSSAGQPESTRVMSFNDTQVRQIIQRMQELKSGQTKTRAEIENDYK